MRCLLRDDHLASAPWRRHRLPRFASDHGRRILVYSLVMAPLLAWCASAGAHPRWVDLTLAQPTPRAHPETTSELLPTGFRKGPYLIYLGDPTRMRVLWQAYENTFCTLGWGTDTLYSAGTVETTEYGDDHQHSYLISDLVPATRYFYRVTLGETSSAASFITAPDDNATSVKFMLHGDTQANAASHDSVCEAMIGEYLADTAYQSLILGVGDVSNFGMLESDWDQYLFNPAFVHIRERLAHVPFNTCIGNHELYESATTYDLDAPLFRKYFPPIHSRQIATGHSTTGRLTSSSPTFIPGTTTQGCRTSYRPASSHPSRSSGSRTISSTNKRWKFVIIHEPGWSAGPHPNNPSVQDTLHLSLPKTP